MLTIQRARWSRRGKTPLRSDTLSDQVTRALAARIVNGEIGEHAPAPTERDICEEFEVSKTTAREVIRALEARGFVEVRHGRRMRVRTTREWNQLDPLVLELSDDPAVVRRYLAELHDVRMLLEPEVAARAALRAAPEQVERLQALVGDMHAVEDDPDAYLEVDIAFHRALAAASDSTILAFVLDSVGELQRVSRKVTNLIRGQLPETTREHRRIADAVAVHEPETARQAMRAHLLTVTHVWIPDADLDTAIRNAGDRERR
jgi:DNA-binding FadR family transcriptional regulator